MAKNKDEFDLDSFDLDDFNMDTGFDDPSQVKDDRAPVVKVASGALDAALDTVKSPGYYGQILRKALPTSYGEAFDVVDTVGSEGVGLYNEVVRDLKPAIRGMKKAAKLIKPRLEPILPKGLSDRLDKILATEEEHKVSQVDAQQASIDASLLEVFQKQTEAQQNKQAEDTVQTAISNKRAQANLDQNEDIRTSLHRIVSFQDGIQMAYLKKSLELKYRHYFAAKDLLDVTKATTTESVALLRTINKNTALPDFVKMRTDEALKEQFRNKLMGSVQGYVTDRTSPFIKEILTNLRKKVKEKTAGFAEGIGNAAMGIETMDEGAKMAAEFGMDGNKMVGGMAGAGAMDWLAEKIGKKIKPYVDKNKKITGTGYDLQRGLNSFPEMVREWSRSGTESFGMKGDMIDFFKSLIGREQTSFNVAEESIDDIKAVAYWSNQDSKTLQEIIPGLLARIHQSSEGIRTGAPADLLSYDFKRNEFLGTREASSRINRAVANESNLRDFDYKTKQFLELIDPNEELSPEVRDKLRMKLMQDSTRKQSFSIKDYNSADAFSGMFDDDTAEDIAKRFSDKVKLGEDGKVGSEDVDSKKNYLMFSNAYKVIRSKQDDALKAANMAGNLGQRDLLRQMGVTNLRDNKDVYNNNYVLDIYKNYLENGRDYEKTIRETSLGGVSDDPFVGPRRPIGGGLGGSKYSTTPTPVDAEKLKAAAAEAQKRAEVEKDPVVTKRYISPYSPRHLRREEGGRDVPFRSKFDNSDRVDGDAADKIVEAIELNASKTAAESMDSKLSAILEAILSIDCSGGDGSGKGKSGRIKRALGAGFRGAKSGISKYFKTMWSLQKKMFTVPFGAAKGGIKKAWEMSKKVRQTLKDRIQDVYIMGFAEPKLTAAKMREGHYVDAESGDPINKISDIKGAVRDLITGNIVLTKDEFDQGLFNSAWKKINAKASSWLVQKGKDLAVGVKNLMFKPVRMIQSGLTSLKEALFTPKDVFVPGETSPRLLGLLMLRGKYFSSKTGKPIRKLGDIDSDVKDENNVTKLTLEEFAKGVVDSEGKPLLTRTAKVKKLLSSAWGAATWAGRKALGLAKTAKDKVLGAAKWAKDKVVGGAGFIKDRAKGLFSGMGLGGMGGNLSASISIGNKYQVEQINVLKKIHNMLRGHFGIAGDDLPMTDMPKLDLGSVKGKLGKFGRRAAARTRLARMKLAKRFGGAGGNLKSKFRLAARKRMLGSKIKSLWGKRPKYKTWKEKLQENIASNRKGNWRQILADRASKTKGKIGAKIGGMIKEKKGIGGAMLTAVLGLVSLVKSAVGKLGDMVSGFMNIRKILTAISAGKAVTDTLGGVADAAGGAAAGNGKGLLSKTWGAVKTGGKWLGAGALGAGRMLLSGGGMLLRGGLMLGGAVMSALSAPVVIAGLAIAGTAVAGYYAYRYFKDKLKPLQKVRFTQYGLPTDDSDFNVQVGEMERRLVDDVEWEGTKAINIKNGKNIEDILAMFGISLSDSESVRRFVGWFQSRFKPVYLTHLTLLRKYAGNTPLEIIDDNMPNQFKAEFAVSSKFAEDDPRTPYHYELHPMIGKQLITGSDQINIAIQEVEDEFGKYRGKSADQVSADKQKTLDRYKDQRDPSKDKALDKVKNMSVTGVIKVDDPLANYGAAVLSGMNKPVGPANYVMDPLKDPSTAITPQAVIDRKAAMPVQYGGNVSDFIKYKHDATGNEGTYSEIQQPVGSGYQAVIGMLEAAAAATGVHPSLLAAIANAESSFNPSAQAKSSSAAGLFQFMPKTWRGVMAKFGDKYGIPANTSPMDPVAASLMAGELTRDNALIVEKKAGIPVGPAEAYIAHFFGAPVAADFLKADPSANAARAFPTQAAQNQPIFFNRDGSSRTIGEVHDKLAGKVNEGKFGVNGGINLLREEQVKPSGTTAPGPVAPATPMINKGYQPFDLSTKAPDVEAQKQETLEKEAKKQKVNSAMNPINFSTFAAGTAPAKKQITQEIQPSVMDPRVAATSKPTQSIYGNEMGALQRQSKTTMDAAERKRMERETQLSANQEILTGYMKDSKDIMKEQLSVQREIRDGIVQVVDVLKSMGSSMGGGNMPPPARSKPNYPVNLDRK